MSEPRFESIVSTIERVRDFLVAHDKPHWARLVDGTLRDLRSSSFHERAELYRTIRGNFLGTMGSVNDLSFFKLVDGEMVADRQARIELQVLLKELSVELPPHS